jgi:hypothetical protein
VADRGNGDQRWASRRGVGPTAAARCGLR